MPLRRCSDLRASSASGSRCLRVAIVLGRTAIAALALGVLRLRARERAPFDVRLVGNGVVLALHWLSFFAAIQVSTVAVGLLGYATFPLFTLVAERVFFARKLRRREGLTALLATAGLVLLVPELSLANPVVKGLGWGIVSGLTFALLVVMNRRWTGTRSATDIAYGQNAWAALVLLPIAVARLGAVGTIGVREIALIRAGCRLHGARAYAVHRVARRRDRAHGRDDRRARTCLRHRARSIAAGRIPGPRTLAGGALIVGAAIAASRRAAGGERWLGTGRANQ